MGQYRVGLYNVDLGLQQRRTDLYEWLVVVRQLDSDQIAFDDCQAGSFQYFTTALGMAN